MNIPEIEKKITDHKLKKTSKPYDFASFNDLCRALDIAPVKGKGQRAALETQFKRFFDYEKIPGTNKLKITGTHYSKPLPYTTKRKGKHWNKFNRAIASLIMMNPSLLGHEDTKYGILKSIGIMHQEPTFTLAGSDQRHTYDIYKQKMYDGLKSAMTQLGKSEYITFTEKYYANEKGKVVELNEFQIVKYHALYDEALEKFGVKNSWQATYTGQSKAVDAELEAKLEKEMGISDVTRRYLIAKGSEYNLSAFKKSYPGVPVRGADKFIIDDAKERFWSLITYRTADKYAKALGIINKKSFEADMEEIKNNK